MAYQPPTARQDVATSRKILEELQLKKQLLLKQGVQSTLTSTSLSSLSMPSTDTTSNITANMMSSAQRAALNHAHSTSFGYFISQDSSFGNIILPVLPSMSKLKLKVLEQYLQNLDSFDNPKIEYEQYATTPHIASRMLHTIQASYDDIEDKLVADLGCGCGMLSAAASMLGAGACIGFDIDSDALRIFHTNMQEFDLNNVDAVQCDVIRDLESWYGKFDTVVMNPPFGTKRNRGMDIEFLRVALKLSKGAIYSLHKTATREHILKKATDFCVKAAVLAELRFDLPASYRFHRKESVDVEVDFIRFWQPKRSVK